MTNHENDEIDIVGCPACGGPAEVADRFVLPSTDGPVEHVKVHCVRRHWFTVPIEKLPAVAGASVGEEPDRWASSRHQR